MGLAFQNSFTDVVNVAIALRDGRCPEGWSKHAWYVIMPGETKTVITGNLGGAEFYWFAQVGIDGPCWSGDVANMIDLSRTNAINQCMNDDRGCNDHYPFHFTAPNRDWQGLRIQLIYPGKSETPNQGFGWAFPSYVDDGGREIEVSVSTQTDSGGIEAHGIYGYDMTKFTQVGPTHTYQHLTFDDGTRPTGAMEFDISLNVVDQSIDVTWKAIERDDEDEGSQSGTVNIPRYGVYSNTVSVSNGDPIDNDSTEFTFAVSNYYP